MNRIPAICSSLRLRWRLGGFLAAPRAFEEELPYLLPLPPRFCQRLQDTSAFGLGRRQGRLSLAQVGDLARNTDDAAVGQASSQSARRLEHDAFLRQPMQRVELKLSNVEM
jgi:hypothetical protein